ncbi:hypothetical protein CEXT_403651 [Caerostris extrusa]|uniref:Uncharacterized protein n=1 Tax=Caerostris extrusa TaxID=172846 RepID=A0AAV4N6T2_CAEEX|nr:hypothetical protein CEXT_403651 [Caerostris extrusa]
MDKIKKKKRTWFLEIQAFHDHAEARANLEIEEVPTVVEKSEDTDEDESLYEVQSSPHDPFVSLFPRQHQVRQLPTAPVPAPRKHGDPLGRRHVQIRPGLPQAREEQRDHHLGASTLERPQGQRTPGLQPHQLRLRPHISGFPPQVRDLRHLLQCHRGRIPGPVRRQGGQSGTL